MDLGSDSDSSEDEGNHAVGGLALWEGGFSVGSGLRSNQGARGGHSKLLSGDAGTERLTGGRWNATGLGFTAAAVAPTRRSNLMAPLNDMAKKTQTMDLASILNVFLALNDPEPPQVAPRLPF